MEYKANYSRRYYVESTAYDFDMFTEKSKRKANVVDFEKAKKKSSPRSKQSSKSVKSHKVNIRLVSTFMVCLLFLGMFGMSIYLRGEINEISAEIAKTEKQISQKESEYIALEVEFDNRVSYKNLETAAAELGMQKAQKHQVNYIVTNGENRSEEIDGTKFITADNN